MRKDAPFIRGLALVLSASIVHAPAAMAASSAPGTMAIIEPGMPVPEMRAVWDGIRRTIYLDPLLLVKKRESVLAEMEAWAQAGDAVDAARRDGDRFTLDRGRTLLEGAWSSYFRFEYEEADRSLDLATQTLRTPGDSRFRANLLFEVLVLKGMIARAQRRGDFLEQFRLAVALDPARKLKTARYSPDIVAIFEEVRKEALDGERVPLSWDGVPPDASFFLDGWRQNRISHDGNSEILPGMHFLEARAPGYEHWSRFLEVQRFEPVTVSFDLSPTGPEGDPETFFLRRLTKGDRPYLAALVQRIGVDYLFVADPGDNSLTAWVIDRDGRTVDHKVLWERDEKPEAAGPRVGAILEPFRRKWDHNSATPTSPLVLPEEMPDIPTDQSDANSPKGWRNYAVAIGLVLLLGAAAAGNDGGTKRVEASW